MATAAARYADGKKIHMQYTVHKVKASVNGLPEMERFVTTEQRPDGTMENHWVWTSSIANCKSPVP